MSELPDTICGFSKVFLLDYKQQQYNSYVYATQHNGQYYVYLYPPTYKNIYVSELLKSNDHVFELSSHSRNWVQLK